MAAGPATTANPGRFVIVGLYLAALAFIGAGLADVYGAVGRAEFGGARLRFSLLGILFLHTVLLLIGFSLASLTAAVARHVLTLRILMVLGVLLGLSLLAAVVLFGLDAIQLAPATRPEGRGRFWITALKSALTAAGAAVLLLIVGISAWRSSRHKPRSEAPRQSGIMVGSRKG